MSLTLPASMRLEVLDPLPLYLGAPKRLQPPPAPAEVPSDGYSLLLGVAIPSPKIVTPRPAEVEAYPRNNAKYLSTPKNHGKPWDRQRDYELGQLWEVAIKSFGAPTAIVEIAKKMDRTPGSIFARLKVLGYVSYDPRTNRFESTRVTGRPMRGPLD